MASERLSRLAVLWAALTLLMSIEAIAADQPLWLAIGRPGLIEGVEPLASHRRQEGFEVTLSTSPVQEALRTSPRSPDFLLLVGDDEPGKEMEPWFLPAKRMDLYRWREKQQHEFASDAAWSERVEGVPKTAVGRIPARSREQVDLVVRKTLAYEERAPDIADLRFLAWCGSPEYGAMDRMAADLLESTVRTQAPSWAEPWMLAADPYSALCGWPPDQPRLFGMQMRQGGALAVLMGHASIRGFFSMRHDSVAISYTAEIARPILGQGPPVMPLVFLACNSGNFVGAEPCLAESLLFMPGGPVATIASTTESHPLTNFFSGVALLHALSGNWKRLGPVWLACQREGKRMRNPLVEMLLRDVEGKLEENINLEKLRRDQPLMYVILGDPATRLCVPDRLRANVVRTDSGWQWSAEKPAGATRLEIGLCPPGPAAGSVLTTRPSQDEAARLLESAEARFRFKPTGEKSADQPWQGEIATEGTLRLVATGRDVFRVCTLDLKRTSTGATSTPAGQQRMIGR